MFDDLRAANLRYASSFEFPDLAARAARGLAVVTCIDTRIEPLAALGLRPGDANILRNAGGRVTPDVLRSLALATALLSVHRIAVMHHTECALAGRTEDQLRAALDDGQRDAMSDLPLLAMPDPEAALYTDVRAIRESTAVRSGVEVEGWRYDVKTGFIHPVIP